MPTPPYETKRQRDTGLRHAMKGRQKRAAAKRALAGGPHPRTIRTVLAEAEESPKQLGRMKVVDLLKALPNIGPARARVIMTQGGINPDDRINRLGYRQLEFLRNLSL